MTDEEYTRRWHEIVQRHRFLPKPTRMSYELLKLAEEKYGYNMFGEKNEPQETD